MFRQHLNLTLQNPLTQDIQFGPDGFRHGTISILCKRI